MIRMGNQYNLFDSSKYSKEFVGDWHEDLPEEEQFWRGSNLYPITVESAKHPGIEAIPCHRLSVVDQVELCQVRVARLGSLVDEYCGCQEKLRAKYKGTKVVETTARWKEFDKAIVDLEGAIAEERERIWLLNDSLTEGDVGDGGDSLTGFDDSITSADCKDVSESSGGQRRRKSSLNTYSPGGKARGDHLYFRFSYRHNTRTRHLHVGGGNVFCEEALRRKGLVEEMLRDGCRVEEIVSFIRGLGNGR